VEVFIQSVALKCRNFESNRRSIVSVLAKEIVASEVVFGQLYEFLGRWNVSFREDLLVYVGA
jgi:hypothetical protein